MVPQLKTYIYTLVFSRNTYYVNNKTILYKYNNKCTTFTPCQMLTKGVLLRWGKSYAILMPFSTHLSY